MAARPETPPVVPPKQEGAPPSSPTGKIVGLAAGELLPLTAIGVAAPVVPAVGAKLTKEGAKALAAILAAFIRFEDSRKVKAAARLKATLTAQFPERTPDEVDALVRSEVARDAEFRRKQEERLNRDLPAAIAIEDPVARKARVEKILARERRYVQQREQMMIDRATARANFATVKQQSPLGAYWKLSDHVREHTPACIAFGNRFWPWEVLDTFHPRIHGGCACTLWPLDQAVRVGVMKETHIPPVGEAVARAKEIATTYDEMHHYVSEGEIQDHIDRVYSEPLLVGIMEAGYALRYAKGTAHGGEFRPRVGGDPGIAKRLLRKLIPHRPMSPMEQEKLRLGKWQTVAGRRVFIPEYRDWQRTFDGRVMRSPSGSTSVHDSGAAKPPPEMPFERGREVTDAMLAKRREHAETAEAVALRALELPHSAVRKPAEVGAHPKATHSGMLAAGFIQHRNRIDPDTGEISTHYLHHGTGASAVVSSMSGRVSAVEWKPGEAPPTRKPLIVGRPPSSFREFRSDLLSEMLEIGQGVGQEVSIGRISTSPDLPDHEGRHHWDGRIELGRDIEPTIEMLAQAHGRELTAGEARGAWASLRTAAHEGVHGINVISPRVFQRPAHRVLEEALTEEIAADVAAGMARRYGRGDVLQWVRSNPIDSKVDGSYFLFRDALGGLLDEAGVEPEQRRTMIHALKYSVRPEDRLIGLAGVLSDRNGMSQEEALTHVDQVLGLAHYDYEGRKERAEAVALAPLTRPDIDDVPELEPIEHEGRLIWPGSTVGVRTADGGVRAAQVLRVEKRDEGLFVATVKDRQTGEVSKVSPSAIAGVAAEPASARLRADLLDLDGVTLRPGFVVSYARADGGRSYARVQRIIRSENGDASVPADGWQIEARTGLDPGWSTNPDEPVLLTKANAPDIRGEAGFPEEMAKLEDHPPMASPGGARELEGYDEKLKGTWTGSTTGQVFMADRPAMRLVDGREQAFWKMSYWPDQGEFAFWIPDRNGIPHHDDVNERIDRYEQRGEQFDVSGYGPGFAPDQHYSELIRGWARDRAEYASDEELHEMGYWDEPEDIDRAEVAADLYVDVVRSIGRYVTSYRRDLDDAVVMAGGGIREGFVTVDTARMIGRLGPVADSLRGVGYGQQAWDPETRTVWWNAGDWTSEEDIDRARAAFLAVDGVDHVEIGDESARPDGYWPFASAVQEGEFEERLHPRGRAGRWVRKGWRELTPGDRVRHLQSGEMGSVERVHAGSPGLSKGVSFVRVKWDRSGSSGRVSNPGMNIEHVPSVEEPGDLIRGKKIPGKGKNGRKGLKLPAKGWKEAVEQLRGTPLIPQAELLARRREASKHKPWEYLGATPDGLESFGKNDWRIVQRRENDVLGWDVFVGDENKGWIPHEYGESGEQTFRRLVPTSEVPDPDQQFLDDFWGGPGRPGRYASISEHPGTEFEAQHARMMEAGARLDAEVERRMRPDKAALAAATAAKKEVQDQAHALDEKIQEMVYEATRRDLVAQGWEELTNDQIFERRKAHTIAKHGGGEHDPELVIAANQPVVDAWDRAHNLPEVRAMSIETAGLRFDSPGRNSPLSEAIALETRMMMAVKSARRAHAYDVLSEVRKFGGPFDAATDEKTRGLILEVESYLPRDWIQSSNDHASYLHVDWTDDRGHYRSVSPKGAPDLRPFAEVKVSPSPEAPGMSRGAGTLLHELVHRAEHTHDGIRGAEWTFYHSRVSEYRNAALEKKVSLREVTKIGAYRDDEVTREDDFVDPYAGKDYGSEMNSNYELLTMGVEDLATGSNGIMAKDQEYRQWVLGMLALA